MFFVFACFVFWLFFVHLWHVMLDPFSKLAVEQRRIGGGVGGSIHKAVPSARRAVFQNESRQDLPTFRERVWYAIDARVSIHIKVFS